MRSLFIPLFVLVLSLPLLATSDAHAHASSDSYLLLDEQPTGFRGTLEVPVRDLDIAIDLDSDSSGTIQWGEVLRAEAAITGLIMQKIVVSRGNRECSVALGSFSVNRRQNGAYLHLPLTVTCAEAPSNTSEQKISYTLFFDQDPLARGFLQLKDSRGNDSLAVFSNENQNLTTNGGGVEGLGGIISGFVLQGIHHIWIGYDHILFLLALLFPALIAKSTSERSGFARCLWRTTLVVSAFTLAHSITLTLAATTVVSLPSRLVESAIALSIIVVAIRNITHRGATDAAGLAFLFGLMHGFGFASVLAEVGLPTSSLWRPLLGFNLGVEVGQLAIVVLFFTIAYPLRHTAMYRTGVVRCGSAIIGVVALVWFVERAFDIGIL